jgi:hypothetical protein
MQDDLDPSCACRACDQPMKLVRRLPKIAAAPELLVFYCRDCDEIDSTNWRRAPSQNTITLN